MNDKFITDPKEAQPISPDLEALIRLLVRAGMRRKLPPPSPQPQNPPP